MSTKRHALEFFTGNETPDLIRLSIPLVTSLLVDYQALPEIGLRNHDNDWKFWS